MTKTGCNQVFLSNDPEILEKLLYMYSDALVRYAYCYVGSADTAEDLMEDAFASLYCKKRVFVSIEQMRAWLYKATRNKALDYLRRHKNDVPLDDIENVLGDGDMESSFLTKERNAMVYTCIQRLPGQYRDVLQLHYFDEFSVTRICDILRRSPKQVYNLLARAKTALKELLIQEGFSYEDL